LVNATGFAQSAYRSELNTLTDDLIHEILEVNWQAQFATTHAFRSLLDESGNGLVVNVSSISASTQASGDCACCLVRAEFENIAISLVCEPAPRIRVLNISPKMSDSTAGDMNANGSGGMSTSASVLARDAIARDVAAGIEACMSRSDSNAGTTIAIESDRRLN
jgi:NAD(P)-dependent dehydrogenase (short-subunit alcohol dehydrogenase family)